MRRAFAAMMVVVCAACGGYDVDTGDGGGGNRLQPAGQGPGGKPIWFDTKRGEVCQPVSTEHNSIRCFPEFTPIDGSQIRYRDAECTELIAWTDLEQESHRYVAFISAEESDPLLVYSIFGVIQKHYVEPGSEKFVPTYRLDSGRCAALESQRDHTYVDITTRIHPEEFAIVDL